MCLIDKVGDVTCSISDTYVFYTLKALLAIPVSKVKDSLLFNIDKVVLGDCIHGYVRSLRFKVTFELYFLIF